MKKTRALGLAASAVMLLAGTARAADIPAPPADIPTPTATPAQRADVLAARRAWAEARDAYLEALRSSAALHNKLGICYQHLGESAKARAEYQKAIDIRPDYAEAWNNLGTLDHALRAYDRAVVSYEKAIALDPTEPVFHKNLGQAWLAQDEVEKALSAWSRALRLDPSVLTAERGSVPAGAVDLGRQYYLFAKLIAARGDVPTALELLGRARDHGYDALASAQRDPDFASVVEDPRFARLVR